MQHKKSNNTGKNIEASDKIQNYYAVFLKYKPAEQMFKKRV